MTLRAQQLLLAFILGFVLSLMASQARAHSWYQGYQIPNGQSSCCGGNDCFEVPYAWLSEDMDNYIVTVPDPVPRMAGLAGTYKPGPYAFPKVEARPTPHMDADDGQEHSGFHACIYGGKARCFFFPANT
jgi:hypothetical protein